MNIIYSSLLDRKRETNVLRSNRGNIFLSLVLTVGFFVLVSIYFQQEMKQQVLQNSFSQVLATSFEIQKTNVISLLSDPLSISATLNHPSNANLKTCKTASCSLKGDQDLVIVDQAGNVILDNSSNKGISPLGINCDSFNIVAGDNNCPYRYKVIWTPDCPPSGACVTPTIYVKAFIEVKFASSSYVSKLNTSRFDYITIF